MEGEEARRVKIPVGGGRCHPRRAEPPPRTEYLCCFNRSSASLPRNVVMVGRRLERGAALGAIASGNAAQNTVQDRR